MFVADTKTIEDIAQKWGIGKQNSDMFASMTLLRPHKIRKKASEHEGGAQSSQASSGNGESKQPSTYDAQAGLKDRLRSMLENEQLIPRELIFLTRGMRMMQSNNQARLHYDCYYVQDILNREESNRRWGLRRTGSTRWRTGP